MAKWIWQATVGAAIVACFVVSMTDLAEAARGPNGDERQPFTLKTVSPASSRAIDDHIGAQLKALDLEPTEVCDDHVFVRRATLDLIGRIPTTAEYERFQHDDPEHRRRNLVRRLLNHERFDHRWAVFFGDVMRIRGNTREGRSLHQFVLRSLRENKPYDAMVTEMLTAVGRTKDAPAGGLILGEQADPLQMTAMVSHAFLGVRMQCAQCHDHPFDIWTREDYYSLAAYFGKMRLREKGDQRVRTITRADESRVLWPPTRRPGVTQEAVEPEWPFDLAGANNAHVVKAIAILDKHRGDADDRFVEDAIAEGLAGPDDRRPSLNAERSRMEKKIAAAELTPARRSLADVLINPRNRLFAKSMANRVWAELNGNGIVMPIDDFRDDNEPSNPALMDHLADEFVGSGYDLRYLIELIMLSDAYQREPLRGVAEQERQPYELAFAARPLRRMHSEMIYDSLITAGHLDVFKDAKGSRMRTRTLTQRYIKDIIEIDQTADGDEVEININADDDASMERDASVDAFEAEGGIDFDKLLRKASDPLNGFRLKEESDENVDRLTMTREEKAEEEALTQKIVYGYRRVEVSYDARLRFSSAYRSLAPNNTDHFLRVFGQPPRQLLGEKRDGLASMRQALILLNGRLANEAARIGNLEALHRLTEPGKPIEPAIELMYIETLTREPTAREVATAKTFIEQADSVRAGVQDLRWALLNSHEFRFVP